MARFCKQHFPRVLEEELAREVSSGLLSDSAAYHVAHRTALEHAVMMMDPLFQEQGRDFLRSLQRDAHDPPQRQVQTGIILEEQGTPRTMDEVGCTAVICLISEDMLYTANVGDSRAVLCYSDKRVVQVTQDHKPDLPAEQERIKKAGGTIKHNRVQGSLSLTRAVGDHIHKNNPALAPEDQIITAFPDIYIQTLKGVDLLILACDGVWDVASSESVGSHFWGHLGPKAQPVPLTGAIKKWMKEHVAVDPDADRGRGTDNMTLIAVDCRHWDN